MVNAGFWGGKRVLVTGHTGFKGGWLCLWLQYMGARVFGYALNPPTKPSLFESAHVAEGMSSIIGDIQDLNAVRRVVADSQPEIVIHMAAQPLVRLSYVNPVVTYSVNVLGTAHLLEACRDLTRLRAVVVITTDKCYENREWHWGYRENEALGGYDPYSSSKACAELVTAAYRQSFFNPSANLAAPCIASARAGNVIGGGDWSGDRLVPDIIRAILVGQPARIRNPTAVRPWQHVLEPLSGYLLLAEKLYESRQDYSSAWNFGPADDDAKPVSWIAERLTQQWGKGASWKVDGGDHPHEATYLKLDSSKARNCLGWRPKLQLNKVLNSLVDWYKADAAGADMKQYTLKQIQSYAAIH